MTVSYCVGTTGIICCIPKQNSNKIAASPQNITTVSVFFCFFLRMQNFINNPWVITQLRSVCGSDMLKYNTLAPPTFGMFCILWVSFKNKHLCRTLEECETKDVPHGWKNANDDFESQKGINWYVHFHEDTFLICHTRVMNVFTSEVEPGQINNCMSNRITFLLISSAGTVRRKSVSKFKNTKVNSIVLYHTQSYINIFWTEFIHVLRAKGHTHSLVTWQSVHPYWHIWGSPC